MYDYLVIGSGLYGATFAYFAHKAGKKCLVIDKRPQVGGNLYCTNNNGIHVHQYGAHIFHTSNEYIWNFVNQFVPFNRYTNCPVAKFHDKIYNLPFNMNTFYELWGITTPIEAEQKLQKQRNDFLQQLKNIGITEPRNLEEQALSLVGKDIYEKLIKGYTEKQWGRKCSELPSFIIKRLPVRFTFDNNYFNDIYQGIPIGGYNLLIDGLLKGVETKININYFENRKFWDTQAKKIIFTGQIDEYYNYQLGKLEYRTIYFENDTFNIQNYQGNAVINYTSSDIPYTRIIEHKHFEPENPSWNQPFTVISKEYSSEWKEGSEPFYPVNDEKNSTLYNKYRELSSRTKNVSFCGRLGEYKYYDMDDILAHVIEDCKNI